MSVAVDGDTALVGAYMDDGVEVNSGAAYIFARHADAPNAWGEVAKLTAADAAAGDVLGVAVAIRGDTVLVGAHGKDDAGLNSGAAYLFHRRSEDPDAWVEAAKLAAGDAAAGDAFGDSVATDGDTALVGAYKVRGLSGAAYLFDAGDPVLEVTIDIKPGDLPNSINPGAGGVIPVAILTTSVLAGEPADVDAASVAPSSVQFGPGGATIASGSSRLEDVDSDGDLDLVMHFSTGGTGIACGDDMASLTGEAFEGQPIAGSDSVRTVPCK